jgi:hypothetical protein
MSSITSEARINGIRKDQFKNYQPTPMQTIKGKTEIRRVADRIIRADINEYKHAVNAAKSQHWQNRELLYQIYQNTFDFDSHFQALVELRLINTVGKSLEYVINDKPVDVSAITDSPEFEKFLRDLLLVRFWGIGAFEFFVKKYKGVDYFGYQQFPIMNINPYERIIYSGEWESGERIPIKGNKMMLGDPDDLGLMLQLSLISIYKRANRNNWANYNELAGDNFMLVKRDVQVSPAERQGFIDKLSERSKNSIIDADFGTEVTFPPSSAGNSYQTFEIFEEALNDEMARMVLGQTMTTDDGSSLSQAQVHERTQESIFDGDAKYLLNFLNYDFYEVQEYWGVPSGGRWRHIQDGSLKDEKEIDIDLKLKELGVNFTDAELRKKYGIESTGDDLGTAQPPASEPVDTVETSEA